MQGVLSQSHQKLFSLPDEKAAVGCGLAQAAEMPEGMPPFSGAMQNSLCFHGA
jgi:hypothetical protein